MKKLFIVIATAGCLLTACKNTANDDSNSAALEKNRQTALNAVSAINNRDINGAFKDYAADFIDYGNGSMSTSNIDSLKLSAQAMFAAFPDIKGENIHAVADSNMVIVTADWSGTFKGQVEDLQPTNKTFKLYDADIYTFNKEGKIASHRSIQSEINLLHQIGVPIPKAD